MKDCIVLIPLVLIKDCFLGSYTEIYFVMEGHIILLSHILAKQYTYKITDQGTAIQSFILIYCLLRI